MIPILFDERESMFETNGIGRLSDVVSCYVTEVRNGEYTLEMKYPQTGAYFEEIKEERIILAKVSDISKPQPFTIFKVSKPIKGVVVVNAQHISYLLNKMVAMPFTAETCQEAMSKLRMSQGGRQFDFWTDKSVQNHFHNDIPRPVRGILGGEENSILDVYGTGEYEFDRFTVRLHVHRGQDRGVALRYGKNIIDLESITDMSTVYTGVVPFWKSESEVVTLPEGTVWSSHADAYAYRLAKTVDFSGDWQEAPTEEQLRSRAQSYIDQGEGWSLPNNVKVSFVNLADTEEYKDIALLEQVRLCDTVTVIDTPLGVNIKAKVVKTVYDVLAERYSSIEIGSVRPNLKTIIDEQVKEPIIAQTSSRMESAIRYATELITGSKGGFLVINQSADGTPNELLIMNTADKNTATQVLRINKDGIGFGNSYNGPFETAWTLDGHFVANYIDTGTLNADLITTGTLSANLIKAGILKDEGGNTVFNLETGNFEMNKGSINIGNGTFVVAENGAVTAQQVTSRGFIRSRDDSGGKQATLSEGALLFEKDGYAEAGRVEYISDHNGTLYIGNKRSNGSVYIETDNLWVSKSGSISMPGITGTYWYMDANGNSRVMEFYNGICIGA